MWRPFRRDKELTVPVEDGLEEARKARKSAQARLHVTTREVTIPLREMHRENHIQPLIDELIRRRAERG